jgi:tetratricopeptide (TPR) repeat protein
MRRIHLYLFIILGVIAACKPAETSINSEVDRLSKELELQPSVEKANEFLNAVEAVANANPNQPEVLRPYLMKAVEVAEKNELYSQIPSFLLPLLRQNLTEQKRLALLPTLSKSLSHINKNHAAYVVYLAMKEMGKDSGQAIPDSVNIENYMTSLFEDVLVNPDETGINRSAAMKFVDASEALALSLPDYPKVPEYLYKSGEIARSIRTLPKAMNLYDWILTSYPNHEDAPKVLFIKGFLLEHEFNNQEEAKLIYEKFVADYPNHEMAESAKFLLKNIGKSEEEILKEIIPQKEVN